MIDVRRELALAEARRKRVEALCDKWEAATEKRDDLIAGGWVPLSETEKQTLNSFAAQVRTALAEETADDPTPTD